MSTVRESYQSISCNQISIWSLKRIKLIKMEASGWRTVPRLQHTTRAWASSSRRVVCLCASVDFVLFPTLPVGGPRRHHVIAVCGDVSSHILRLVSSRSGSCLASVYLDVCARKFVSLQVCKLLSRVRFSV